MKSMREAISFATRDNHDVFETLGGLPARSEVDALRFQRFWLFGATAAADPVIAYLHRHGKGVAGFIDNRAAQVDREFRDRPLLTPTQWLDTAAPTDAVIIVSAHQQPIASQLIDELKIAVTRVFPYMSDMFAPSFGRGAIETYANEIRLVREWLADAPSRNYFDALLRFRWTMDARWLAPNPRMVGMYNYESDEMKANPGETVVDAGAFDGDTVSLFLERAGATAKVYAIEAFAPNFARLLKKVKSGEWGARVIPVQAALAQASGTIMEFSGVADGDARAHVIDAGIRGGHDVRSMTLDQLFPDHHQRIDLIKLDIEGSEAAALRGAIRLLKRDAPRLIVAAYHRPRDLWEIPQLIRHELSCRGPLFLGHHPAAHYEPEWFVGKPG